MGRAAPVAQTSTTTCPSCASTRTCAAVAGMFLHVRAPPARWRTAAIPRAPAAPAAAPVLNIDRQAVRGAHPGGVPFERPDQAVVDGFAAQLEDQRADLALHAPGGPRSCSGSSDGPGGAAALLDQSLQPCARVQDRREQGLRHRIVQIPSYPAPFLQRPLALGSAGFAASSSRIAPARSPRRSRTASSALPQMYSCVLSV